MPEPPEPAAETAADDRPLPPDGSVRARNLLHRLRARDGGTLGAAVTIGYAGLVLALWAATWMGQRWSAPPGWFAAVITFLPYAYATMLAVGFFVWTGLPDRRLLPVALGALLVSAASLWGPSWPASADAADEESVQVMAWNLRRLWGGPDDGGDALSCVVSTLEVEPVDVLALTEVSAQDVEALQERLDLSCVHHTYRSDQGPRSGGLATCTRNG